ncbi:MAG: hypothetical protein JJU20_10900 [Opitutales bacterium]|nr:hypothetical protein [Opitutales bacterium]
MPNLNRKSLPALLVIGLPMAILLIYLFIFASGRYETESKFYIRSAENGGSLPAGGMFAALLSAGSGGMSHDDANIIVEYIRSQDMLELLDERFSLREAFSSRELDVYSRLRANASNEEFLEFYRKQVEANIGPSSIVTLRFRAFDPELARDVHAFILKESEAFVNRISKNLANMQIDFIHQEVDRSEQRLRRTRNALLAFQNEAKSVDPEQETTVVFSNISALESQLSSLRAELTRLRSYLTDDAHQVFTLRAQIRGLEQQIQEEKGRLTGDQESLNQLIFEYQNYQIDNDFAMQAFTSAYASLEATRLEASQQLKNLVAIQRPALPMAPAYPRKGYILLSALLVLTLSYAIGRLVLSVINDHRP